MKYSIIVSRGNFKSVEAAAYGENSISWEDFSSDECRAVTECFAAIDAKNVLSQKKNLDVTVCDISEYTEDSGTLIFLGAGSAKFAAEKYSIPYFKTIGEDSYRIFSTKKEGFTLVLIYGNNRRATAYGMIEYLNYHGIRFVSPDEYSTSYEKELDKSSNEEFDVTEAPSFKSREAYSEFMADTSKDFFLWAFHNKINRLFIKKITNPEFLHKLCFTTTGGGHEIWYKFMDVRHEYPYKHKLFGGEGKPKDPYAVSPLYRGDENDDGILSYGEAHPEWFAEIGGTRTLKRDYDMYERFAYPTGDFICTENEDGTSEFTRLVVDSLANGENKDVTNFKLFGLDNGNWCECERCRRHKSLSYRLLMLAYKLDKAIKKATQEGRIKRDITIEIPAYHETLPPPDKALPDDFDYSKIYVTYYVIERCYLHNINDEVCEETNKSLCDGLLAWTNGYYKGEIMVGEYYNVSSFAAMPFLFAGRMKNDFPFYYSIGVRHLTYMHMLARKHGLQALNNYIYTRLTWNKDASVDALISEYMLARYGSAADKMRELYREIEEAGRNCKYIKHYQGTENEDGRKTFALSRFLNYPIRDLTNFFPLKHVKLDRREDDAEAGPSFKETVERYEAVFEDFSEFINGKDSPALSEDYDQLYYAVCTLNYMYNRILYNLDEKNEEALSKTEAYREKLLEISSPLAGYDFGDRYKNGFSALNLHEQPSKTTKKSGK